MNKQISMFIGAAGIVLSLILLAVSTYYFHHLVELVKVHVSPDNTVTPIGEAKIRLRLYFFIGSIFFVAILFAFNIVNKLIAKIPFRKVYNDVERIFFQDPACARTNNAKHFFFIGTAIAVLIQFSVIAFGEPEWEGLTDKYSSSLFLLAAILLLLPIRSLRKLELAPEIRKKIKRGLVIISAVCFVMYGEEISWGQQYFEIETASLFELNYQQENTFHNFFNPVFDYVYALVGFGSFIVLSYLWFMSKPKGMLTKLFLPHISLYLFLLSMTGAIYSGASDELYEAYLAIFAVMYAARLIICIKNPGKLFFNQANVPAQAK